MGARAGAVPESRLVLNTKELACPVLRERVAGRFAGLGIGADRLDLRPGGSHVEMLAAYGEVDVALDPMPYSGGLTTLEALWMGVPVVTLPGRRFCARHSVSHVTVLGHPEWVARPPTGMSGSLPDFAEHTDAWQSFGPACGHGWQHRRSATASHSPVISRQRTG